MDIARKIIGYFFNSLELATYDDKSEYVRVKDDAPDWVTNTIHELHGDLLPNDWVYATVYECASTLEENESTNWEDLVNELTDSQLDCYNNDLLKWVSDYPNVADYINQSVSDGLVSHENLEFFSLIRTGQYLCVYEIFSQMISMFMDYAENVAHVATEENDDWLETAGD